MAWHSTQPDNNWEPKELRSLKQQLANLNCQCTACEHSKNHGKYIGKNRDKEVQYEEIEFYRSKELPVIIRENVHHCYYKNSLCPDCFILKSIVRDETTKTLKDEESETTPENFRCDKSIGDTLSVAVKSSSATNKLQSKFSNVSLCDFISVCSSCSTELDKQKSNVRVKFVDSQKNEVEAQKLSLYGDCLCLEKFVNSIRPPLL